MTPEDLLTTALAEFADETGKYDCPQDVPWKRLDIRPSEVVPISTICVGELDDCPVVVLEPCAVLVGGELLPVWIGQCSSCRTMYWSG